jgi:hypothetical protein
MKVTLYRKEPLESDFHWFMPLRRRGLMGGRG